MALEAHYSHGVASSVLTSSVIPLKVDVQDLNLPRLFEKMEELKQHAGVEEYSISQTTLEHVFVQLAQQ